MSATKIVLNRCFGGFSLSPEATREYLRRAELEWTEEEPQFGLFAGPIFRVSGEHFFDDDIERTDPILVLVVEDMGEAANGEMVAWLEVHEVPKGARYRIDDYDGYERIELADKIEWAIA